MQNGIAERRIGLVMEVARTSMIHAAAPHFLWPFAVQYAAHQLNLWPRASLPETSPTLHWTGEVGDASVFRVWGSRAFVRDTSADKLSPRAIPCVFLGFVPDAPGWQFYHPTSHCVLPSQDITFDESVPFYHLFPYRSTPPLPPPLFLAPGPPPVDPLPPQGPAPSGVSQVDPLPGPAHVQVAVGSGAASGGAASGGAEPRGAGSEGAETGGAEPGGVGTGGAEPEGVEPGGAASEGAESGGAEPQGAASSGGSAGALPRLCLQQLREWFVRRARLRSGATGAGGAGGARVAAGASGAGGAVGTDRGGDVGAAGAGVGGTGAVDPCAGGAGGTVLPRPYFVLLLQQSVSLHVSPVCTAHRNPRSRPPPLPRMDAMALCPSSVPLRVTDPSFESVSVSALVAELLDLAVACRLDYATALVVESASASPPSVGGSHGCRDDILEVHRNLRRRGSPTWGEHSRWHVDFQGEAAAGSPPAFKARYVARGLSQRQGVDYFQTFSPTPKMTTLWVLLHVTAQRDYELHSLDFSTPFLQGSLHEEIWLRRPSGFTRTFPAGTQWSLRRPVYGLRQVPREWHDTLRTTLAALGFAPSTMDPSLFLPTDTSLPPFYVLVYVDDLIFATADIEALTLVKSELQKRHTCTDLGELRCYLGLQITRDRARRTITLTQSHMVHQVLQGFGFLFSLPQPTPLSTSHSLSAPPSDESIEPSGPYPELVGCLLYLMTCTRPDLAYPLSLLPRYVAPGRH
ncbi:unnamed protein product [Closterium sp. NIES-54]